MKKMSNPFFEAFRQRTPSQGPNIFTMAQQFKANPIGFLMQKKMNLPPNVNASDPNAILNYLVNSGQVSQSRVDWARQQMPRQS